MGYIKKKKKKIEKGSASRHAPRQTAMRPMTLTEVQVSS